MSTDGHQHRPLLDAQACFDPGPSHRAKPSPRVCVAIHFYDTPSFPSSHSREYDNSIQDSLHETESLTEYSVKCVQVIHLHNDHEINTIGCFGSRNVTLRQREGAALGLLTMFSVSVSASAFLLTCIFVWVSLHRRVTGTDKKHRLGLILADNKDKPFNPQFLAHSPLAAQAISMPIPKFLVIWGLRTHSLASTTRQIKPFASIGPPKNRHFCGLHLDPGGQCIQRLSQGQSAKYLVQIRGSSTSGCSKTVVFRPIYVPWASPSLRQHAIAKVLNNFQCAPISSLTHDYMQCYTPAEKQGKLTDETKHRICNFSILSASIRSRAGNSSSSSNNRTTVPSSTTLNRYSSRGISTNLAHLHNEDNADQENSQDEDDGQNNKRPRKRKRGESTAKERNVLPCIFHVFDPTKYKWGGKWKHYNPEWKHCDPTNSTYSDPSALSRHLSRKHEMIDDKTSVRRADPPAAVCKNCWNRTANLNSQDNGKHSCNKPTRRLSPIEKWWAWYEAFCGPRTTEAAALLEKLLMGEEHRQLSHQLPIRTRLQIQPTFEISNSQPSAMGLPSTEAVPVQHNSLPTSDFPQPSDSQPIFQEFSPAPQPSPVQVNMQLNNIANNQHSAGFIRYPASLHTMYSHERSFADQPDQNMAQNFQYLTKSQWNEQAPNNPNVAPYGSSPVFQGRPNDVMDLMVQLHIAREQAQLQKERAQQAEEKNRQLEEIIRNLSRTTISPSQIMGQPPTEVRGDPVLYSTPARSSTRESTDSDLSGIAARDAPTTVTLDDDDDLMADLFPGVAQPVQQDMQDTQYLTEENNIPHNDSKFPSSEDDSGYCTLPMDMSLDFPVKPLESNSASLDSSLVPPHT